jgi:hypothetical protein
MAAAKKQTKKFSAREARKGTAKTDETAQASA